MLPVRGVCCISPGIRILLVDDEPALLELGRIFLTKSENIMVDTAASARAAQHCLSLNMYDAIVSDYEMPEMNGIDFLKHLRSEGNTLPFILFTGRGREEVVIEALNNGATFYLQKGHDAKAQYAELVHKIRQAVRQCRAERSVRESKRRVEQLINFLPDPTIAMDREGRLIMWNRATEEMTGVMASDVMGKGDYEYTIPFFGKKRPLVADLLINPDNDNLARYYRVRKKEGNVLIGECQASLPDGRKLELWETASLLYDADGEVTGVIESIRDITARKQIIDERKRDRDLLARKNAELMQRNEQLAAAEEELRQTFEEQQQEHLLLQDSERNYRNLVESLPDALIIHDDGKILFVNPAALRLFRKNSPEETRQQSLFSFFGADQGSDIDAQSRLTLAGSIPLPRREYHIMDPVGSTIVADAAFSPVRYQDTRATQVLFRDVSAQKTLEGHIISQNAELRHYSSALDLANKKLQLMYSITRHDILNQVQVLQGYTALARSQTDDATLQDYLERQERVIQQIHQQILFTRDFQDIGIRAPEWQNIPHLVADSIAQIPLGRVTCEVQTGGLEILADRLLEKIFFNLIDNSLRHGEHTTGIRIHCRDSGNGMILVFEDNGVGIPDAEKKKIFDRGFGKNTGLGLYLTREILAITGITITETGEPGSGVRFEMLVPSGKFRITSPVGKAEILHSPAG